MLGESVDYDSIASTYHQRYTAGSRLDGVARALRSLAKKIGSLGIAVIRSYLGVVSEEAIAF
ncbi:MAG: hypothetical protein FJ030_19150 [Chloroflexi bacterium]|nr:hypothetical protein [Chloroflexota bacterium]